MICEDVNRITLFCLGIHRLLVKILEKLSTSKFEVIGMTTLRQYNPVCAQKEMNLSNLLTNMQVLCSSSHVADTCLLDECIDFEGCFVCPVFSPG